MTRFTGMRRFLSVLTVASGPLLTASPVAADNCGSLTDCFNSIPPAVLAVGAIAIAILILAFLPAILTAISASFSWLMTGEFVAGTAARLAGIEAWGAAAMSEAEIAAGIEAAIARAEFAELLGVLARGANPLSGTVNCQMCVQTITTNLGGDVGAVAPYVGPRLGVGGIAETFGGSLGAETTAAGIDTAMAGAPQMGQGWVVVQSGNYSHIFNAVRFGGETFFVDGQIGFVGGSAAETAAAANYGPEAVFTLIGFF